MNTFHVGNKVEWTSQAGSYAKKKTGVVAAIVSAGNQPSHDDFPKLAADCGICGRKHESYVVLVGKKAYWPRVSQLKRTK